MVKVKPSRFAGTVQHSVEYRGGWKSRVSLKSLEKAEARRQQQ